MHDMHSFKEKKSADWIFLIQAIGRVQLLLMSIGWLA